MTTPTHNEPSSKPTPRQMLDAALLATGPLLTSEEVAHALRLSPRTLADWRYGRGPANGPKWLCLADNKPLYPLSEVNRFLQEQLAAADARRESTS
ncbi:helix-turn-helix domain-containing protein [Nocardioides sp.]|uniref:helix-turn-helix domain-containing protein n=1 Tax=Nocardioides sp. TaxID=35761 RepID=UPI002CD58161|nr:helix-turn-helix domain-containing protein [Nocardioides sp.]HXH81108.1 helix-turn-helix domain-containing protein [Nocardioides sp.]